MIDNNTIFKWIERPMSVITKWAL